MNKLHVARGITKFVVGAGTAKIVNQILDHNTDPAEKLTDKLSKKLGSAVIAGIVVERANQYINDGFAQLEEQLVKFNIIEAPESE